MDTMENLRFTCKLCISICWGLLLMYAAAEEQYFLSSHNVSWEKARNHCQVCFKEMVTLTPQNVHIIAKMINSDHWIGLRKYINYNDTYNDTYDYDYEEDFFINPDNSTNTSSKSFGTPWTRWANGDPLMFQNWYPGYPVFKSPLPKIDCCSCSCTCPAPIQTTTNPPPVRTTTTTNSSTGHAYGNPTGPKVTENGYESMTGFEDFENITDMMNFSNETNHTQPWESSTLFKVHTTDSPWTTTPQLPIFSTCERSPMLPPIIPENNKNYIENSCVVILSFGPWVERVCMEQLPFICYEERFMGTINISNITSSSGSLQWEEGPGNIDHYRLKATSREDSWNFTTLLHNLSFILYGLTPGTGYNIKVFPLKCGRVLNPQNSTFYTIPGEVRNLSVTSFTETSVSLRWKKPEGNYGFFRITAVSKLVEAKSVSKDIKEEHMVFDGLIQGNEYEFIFITGVDDHKRWSENVSISNCTLPGKVSSLIAEDNTNVSLSLKWKVPEGTYSGFEVKAFDGTMSDLMASVGKEKFLPDKQYQVMVSGLPNGNKINLFVKVLSNCSLEGKSENITTYTAPGPISNLTLEARHNSLDARWDWNQSHGNVSLFISELFLGVVCVETKNSAVRNVTFENLKTASRYILKVYAVFNNLKSPAVESSIFTLPSPPTEAKVFRSSENTLMFEWTPPENSSASEYICTLRSTFWNYCDREEVNETKCNFTGLKSGSTYQFEVYTLSDNKTSKPATCKGETVKNEMEVSLSMLCTSEKPLYCDQETTRDGVLAALIKHFSVYLGGHVFYDINNNSIKSN